MSMFTEIAESMEVLDNIQFRKTLRDQILTELQGITLEPEWKQMLKVECSARIVSGVAAPMRGPSSN